jgi:hypothetical protein
VRAFLVLFLMFPMLSEAREWVIHSDYYTIVVEQSDAEAMSTGSVAIRYYEKEDDPSLRTFFEGGVIVPREGTVIEARLFDVDADGAAELVVVTESVGTGSYKTFMVFEERCGVVVMKEDRTPSDPHVTIEDVFQ